MDKAKAEMMTKFNNWLRAEITGINSANADSAFDFAARTFLRASGEVKHEAVQVNYSKRGEIKRQRMDRESKRDAELREGHNWLGRGIGARGDWDI